MRATPSWECALRHLGRCHPDANVFQRLEQCLRETDLHITPTALVNAGRPRTVRTPGDEDDVNSTVE
jgi:hypothetical protein